MDVPPIIYILILAIVIIWIIAFWYVSRLDDKFHEEEDEKGFRYTGTEYNPDKSGEFYAEMMKK